MTLSLTEREIQKVLDACTAYTEIMSEGEDTYEYTIYEIETGLGSALRKLSKGRNDQHVYAKYKTVTKYPTFDEWKAARAESDMVVDCETTKCEDCINHGDCDYESDRQ